MIEHSLKCYGDRLDNNDNSSDETGLQAITQNLIMNYVHTCAHGVCLSTEVYYELSEDKVCQFYAELLLRPAGKVRKTFVYVSCGLAVITDTRRHLHCTYDNDVVVLLISLTLMNSWSRGSSQCLTV